MASASTTKAQRAVGSTAWIAAERENIQLLINQEMEEIDYPVQNEMDWLNQHMAEIFSRNQFNVTEIFKTPGKLRGKTPRTARKHKTPQEARVPLGDIFSAQQNVRNSPAPPNRFHQDIAKLAPKSSPKEQPKYSSPVQYHQTKQPIYNTDSGYHGMPDEDDEMDLVYSEPHKDPEPGSKSVPEPERQAGSEQESEEEPEQHPQSNPNLEAHQVLEPESEPESHHQRGPEPVETDTQPLEDSTIVIPRDRNDLSPSVDRRTTDASFHSAREVAPSKESTVEPMDIDDYKSTPTAAPKQASSLHNESPQEPVHLPGSFDTTSFEKVSTAEVETHEHDTTFDHHFDDIGSPSDGSTPDRPPIRKSSLSFASLPAREPITTKRSMGGHRMSRTSHIDPSKSIQGGYYGRQTGGARITQILPEGHAEQENVEENTKSAEDRAPAPLHEDSELTTKGANIYNKSSTQLLHEKINMLGKSQPSRSTKSIPAPAPNTASHIQYPELLSQVEPVVDKPRRPSLVTTQTYDSRTAPTRSPQQFQPSHFMRDATPERPPHLRRAAAQEVSMSRIMHSRSPEKRSPAAKPFGATGAFHSKSASTSIITSPRVNTVGHQRTTSNRETVTPVSSPRRDDGPLSASKSRLQSIMKTAKGLFTSTGSVSTAAKMEALTSSPTRSHTGLYPNLQEMFSQEPQPPATQSPSLQEGRRTRSSTEREEKRKEKERQEAQRMEEQLRKTREQETQGPAMINSAQERRPPPKSIGIPAAPESLATRSSPRRPPTQQSVREPEQSREAGNKFTVPAKQHPQPKQNENRRPVRPTREIQKPKPQPVSIRVGTLSQRIPLSSSSLSSSVQEPAPNPTPAAKAPAPAVNKKGSKLSIQTNTSTSSFKSATSTTSLRSKAAQAAEKKKEEQREAQRKLEQRREAERKRVAHQEEARRQEQASRAEAERRERERSVTDDPKKLAHKQAIEKRRLENARKLEQQRSQQPTPVNDLGSILHQEKIALQGSQRNDLPSTRPSRLNSTQEQARTINYPPPNPAKPPKRALEDESSGRPVTGKVGAAIHQVDGKRRKTEDEIASAEPPVRSTMAPPIRQSNVRKQTYNHGYSTMQPPPVPHQAGPSIFKNPPAPRHFQPAPPMQSQQHRNGHPLEMSKFANGKIPFADNANPPHPSTHKTPAQGSQKVLKSSPAYPNGDSIKLPEILTDSEDEDSDTEPYNVPDWAKPENLNNILINQEGKDGEQVFGPSAPLHMEEIFKDNKDRFKRFRDRTSSANWAGPDGLTQDEIKWDLAERERLKRNGGWTFGP
ncbi:inner centromere protein [Histoplasma capsulatum]|uniref:Inner centromere protein n=1 Tax=Ajellomyces capsulatus TaxID=5037 RepID=A0A8A1MMX1_AJECA|nr:predicted protein [Histoplasma mississippiense (nom. inval.)]EDN04994.1 predicted protein [Histoplasma mississippiense (nom. inval.)]QSS66540.1 inner centromere protein [Histoplasma capsulatum]